MNASIEIQNGVKTLSGAPVDAKYYNNAGTPYTNVAEVNSQIPSALRGRGLTVNVAGVEYWYKDGILDTDLVVKTSTVEGANGLSAYEIAVNNGFVGTEAEWLDSLHGNDGADGANGQDGANGLSAYEIAVDNGFVGTEAQWLASLQGNDGADGANGQDGANGADGQNGANGLSAYEIAVDNGFVGTEAQWLASLQGNDGADGANGMDGTNGQDGKSAYQSYFDTTTDNPKLTEEQWSSARQTKELLISKSTFNSIAEPGIYKNGTIAKQITGYRIMSNATDFSISIGGTTYTKDSTYPLTLNVNQELIITDVTIQSGYNIGNVILIIQ